MLVRRRCRSTHASSVSSSNATTTIGTTIAAIHGRLARRSSLMTSIVVMDIIKVLLQEGRIEKKNYGF